MEPAENRLLHCLALLGDSTLYVLASWHPRAFHLTGGIDADLQRMEGKGWVKRVRARGMAGQWSLDDIWRITDAGKNALEKVGALERGGTS